jgi:hypothetical protein
MSLFSSQRNEVKINQLESSLAQNAQHPLQKGAKGDGTTDDTSAIINANAVNGNLLISNGTFRITQNITLNHVFFLKGGSITVDSGVTVTIGSVISDPATIIFKGAGTIVTKNQRYSVGWFDGAYFNNKWDFCRRAWRTLSGSGVGTRKYVHVPNPKSDDPACGITSEGQLGWLINAPVQIEFDDDCLIFDSEAIFKVVSATQGFVLSPYNASASNNNKTDEVRFPKGLVVEGGSAGTPVGTDGLVISGGARITFDGETRFKNFTNSCVTIDSANAPTEEIIFNFLEVTGFSTTGLIVRGQPTTTTSRVSQSNLIRYLFTNGGNNGCTNVVQINGVTRNIKIENYFENSALTKGYYDVSDSQILIQATSDGESRQVTLQNLYCAASTKPVVKTVMNGGSAKITNLVIDKIYSVASTVWLNLANASYVDISNISSYCPTGGIVVGSDCDHVNVKTSTPSLISGNCQQLFLNNAYYGNFDSQANQTVNNIWLNSNVNGFFDVTCKDDPTCSATFLIRSGGAVVPIVLASNATIQSGTQPTGTTGTAGKVNIFLYNNRLYVENQIGTARSFVIHGLSY